MALFKNMLANLGHVGLFANILKTGAAITVCTLLACSGDSSSESLADEHDSDDVSVAVSEISGVTQKGPFLMGSKVEIFEISNGRSLNQTGKSFNGKISNDKGEFKINGSKLVSQYVILEASGYYRNENTGKNSNSELTLLAISDVKNRNTININLLTHLEYERVNYLVTEGNVKVEEAKKQAQKEILEIFDIDNENFSNSEDLNIAGASDEDGALLAISILLQGDRSESQLSELLTKIAIDMEKDGEWDDVAKQNEIADWAAEIVQSGRIATIRENIEKWELSSVVPNFEKYINNFWWNNYELGVCDKAHKGKILQNANRRSEKFQTYYICKDGLWNEASTLEFDTYQWASGKDGEIKKGNVTDSIYVFDKNEWRTTSKVESMLGGCVTAIADSVGKVESTYYICKSSRWVKASVFEYDTYHWNTGKDGDAKYGDVVKTNCYVYDEKVWRSGNSSDCSLGLRGCTVLRQDTVGKGSDKVWHICDSQAWRNATTYEKDTFGWNDSTDGAIKKGNVTDTVYVFDKTSWRATSNEEAKLGGCVTAIADSVGKVGSIYYICKSNKWVEASVVEYDTYRWNAGKDGDSKYGSVNTKNCYVYENKIWRSSNTNDCTLKLRGCTALRQDTVGLGDDKVWYKCEAQTWRVAIDIEKDTATLGAGKFDGEVRAGQVNKNIYYIYEHSRKAWRNATTMEKDTYDYKNNRDWAAGKDGEIKKGSATDSIYVFDATAWRVADEIEKVLGGCVIAIQDSVGKVENAYYICNPRKWEVATELQYDTYKRECSENGKMFNGNVNATTKYVCDKSVFRAATEVEVEADSTCTSYNRNGYYILPKYDGKRNYSYYKCTENGWTFTTEKLNRGSMVDERDGHEYKTIGIKSQMWMAENLNYADSLNYPSMLGRNWCRLDEKDCKKYGRYYTWSAAIDSVYWKNKQMDCGYKEDSCDLPEKVQGICPNNWHLPNRDEWLLLYSAVANDYRGLQVKGYNDWNKATDKYGFSALPASACDENGCNSIDEYSSLFTEFWSSSENGADSKCAWAFEINDSWTLMSSNTGKFNGISVRCVKDE